ncbi:MAG: glutamate-1-semialdehyde 2,1-aminomutase [Peptococcaceae bacterium]|nr:MAG: glutamate-1-semialdehyde 2,1-aminomutase [Peptococcaceae bacterium]
MTLFLFASSKILAEKAARLIPAGCHTYSKGADQFPFLAPGFILKGSGCCVTDVDGNEFLDWGMGLRSVALGHCYPAVLEAVYRQLRMGANFTRPSPVEVELAQLLTDLIPSAEMVKLAKNGSDVTSAAIRLARAHTGRDYVAVCREQPFFSFYDWFIGSTPCNAGIPAAVRELTLKFSYNDLAGLEDLFRLYPDKIAAVILEPVSTEAPEDGFLQKVRDLTRSNGTVLIFDEMISGFRWHLSGAQEYFGVIPDLSTFGKAMGNGFSAAALVGKREIMELGGLTHDREKVFLLSSTHGGETHAIAAAIATINEMREKKVIGHIWRLGRDLQNGFNEVCRESGLSEYVRMSGYPCSPFIVCKDRRGEVSLPLRTLLLQEFIKCGVLIPYISISFSHTAKEVDRTLEALRKVLVVYREAMDKGVEHFLTGPPVKPVFRKYN